MHTIQTMRERSRNDIAALIKDIFAFHERFIGHALTAITYAGAALHRTREGTYVVYGVDNTIYFSSGSTVPFHEHFNEWLFPIIAAARTDGILPRYRDNAEKRTSTSKP